MNRKMTAGVIVSTWIALMQVGFALAASAAERGALSVISDRTVTGFVFPESVDCDPVNKVLYVSDNRDDQFHRVEPAHCARRAHAHG